MRSAHPSDPQWATKYDEVHRAGEFSRSARGFNLMQDIDGALDNYQFQAGGSGEGEGTQVIPRHRHNCAQIRHPLDELTIETKDPAGPLHAGWVGYYPESCYYGPNYLRAGRKVGCQFGGPSGQPYLTRSIRKRGKELCLEHGEFAGGIYSWTDQNDQQHNQDGYEAVWEHAFGRPIMYPEPLYDIPVFMNPADYEWEEVKGFPGTLRKTLGVFERDIRVGFIQVEQNASFEFGAEPSNEVMYLEEGSLSCGGVIHPVMSGFSSARVDRPEVLTALELSTLYYVKMPTFD